MFLLKAHQNAILWIRLLGPSKTIPYIAAPLCLGHRQRQYNIDIILSFSKS